MASLRDDIHASFRADGAALLDPVSGHLYALNTSASVIAQCLRDGQTEEGAADILAAHYGLTNARALNCVQTFIEQCRSAGLIDN
jgi:hypothetical protein